MVQVDVLIIGAGAAGLMCAIEAGRRGRLVQVLEKAKKPGQKIRISGGGKSNFTNLYVSPENYLSDNPHFCKSALARYTQWDFMQMMAEAGLSWEEREHGQLFCEQGAQSIIDMLMMHCYEADVQFKFQQNEIRTVQSEQGFVVKADQTYHTQSLVVATGGPSIPRMGSSDFGIQQAKQYGLHSLPFRPALVPFTFSSQVLQHYWKALSGISLEVEASCNGFQFREQLLCTHRGLSGPVILQISSYWKKGDAVYINWLPDLDASQWLIAQKSERPDAEFKPVLAEVLPKRLAQKLCEQDLGSLPMKQYLPGRLDELGSKLNSWPLQPAGTEGMRTAEAATGGVDTGALSSKTMEAKSVPGLYFIGETVDVTGHLGGFNFQWAWSSGWCCGQVC